MALINLELYAAMAFTICLVFISSKLAVSRGFPVTPLDQRLGCVDGLRGFLAFAVVFHHFAMRTYLAEFHTDWVLPVVFFNNLGKAGVAVFFMITGAVFYPRISAGFDRIKWSQLYVSRAFRILPLSIIVVALAATISAIVMGGVGHASPLTTLKNLLNWVTGHGEPPLFGYQHSNRLNAGVMWSLYFEWLFYLAVIPVMSLVAMLLRGRAPSFVGPAVLLVGSMALHILKPGMDIATYLSLFAFGMVAAELNRVPKICGLMSKNVVGVVLLAASAACMAVIPQPYSPVSVTVYALFFLAVACGNNLFGLLTSAAARGLGDSSFSIYMLHGLILTALFSVSPNLSHWPLINLPVAAVLIVAVSMLSYVFVERPMIESGKRVAGWLPRKDRSLSIEVAP